MTDEKFGGAAQRSAANVNSTFELLTESFKLLLQFRAISFQDFVNECSQAQRNKFLLVVSFRVPQIGHEPQ